MLIFREKLSLKYWLGLLIALGGMAVILGGNAFQELQFNLGDLLAIVASVLYAAFMLITQKARASTDTLTLNTLTMLTSTIVLLPVILAFGHPLTGFDTRTWMALLGLGLLPQVHRLAGHQLRHGISTSRARFCHPAWATGGHRHFGNHPLARSSFPGNYHGWYYGADRNLPGQPAQENKACT